MINREFIKSNAKKILNRNYGWALVIAIIASFVGGGANFSSSSSDIVDIVGRYEDIDKQPSYENMQGFQIDEETGMFSGILYEEEKSPLDELLENSDAILSNLDSIIVGVLIVLLVIAVIGIAFSSFVLVPIQVGCKKWFINNSTENAQFSDLGYVFKNGYINTVKIMFVKGIYEFLWSLLFIIPGIIKSYEYRMIPYLLAENPEMSMEEAFSRSKAIMDGKKMDTFVYDLSFIGWAILTVFTCGLVGVLYYNPYKHIADAELYIDLCGITGQTYNSSNTDLW